MLKERLEIETEHLKMQEDFMKEENDTFQGDYDSDIRELE